MLKRNQGFTLVELLVVIAIVGILAGVLLLAINPAQMLAKGRDSKRLQDMDSLNKALSLALADGEITLTVTGTCTSCTSLSGTQAVDGTGWVKFAIPTGKTGLSKYVATLPVDALNTGTNVYTYGATALNYELNTVLESTENAAKMTTDGGGNANAYEVGTSLTIIP